MPAEKKIEDAKFWEELLQESGLSVDAGTNPGVLSYGWNNDWQERPAFDYSLRHSSAPRGGRRVGAGRPKGKKTAKCFRHLSPRCKCSNCVNSARNNQTNNSEGI